MLLLLHIILTNITHTIIKPRENISSLTRDASPALKETDPAKKIFVTRFSSTEEKSRCRVMYSFFFFRFPLAGKKK